MFKDPLLSTVGQLPESALNAWAAFLSLFPAGEDAADVRIMTLRHDIYELLDHLRHTIGVAHNCSDVPLPREKDLSEYKIFKRFPDDGQVKRKSGDFRGMDASDIASSMSAMAKMFTGKA